MRPDRICRKWLLLCGGATNVKRPPAGTGKQHDAAGPEERPAAGSPASAAIAPFDLWAVNVHQQCVSVQVRQVEVSELV